MLLTAGGLAYLKDRIYNHYREISEVPRIQVEISQLESQAARARRDYKSFFDEKTYKSAIAQREERLEQLLSNPVEQEYAGSYNANAEAIRLGIFIPLGFLGLAVLGNSLKALNLAKEAEERAKKDGRS